MVRILQFFALLLATLSSISAVAHDFEVEGIYYNISGNEVIVTYKGSNYYDYDEYTNEIVIPASVNYFGKNYSVTSIGPNAFRDCYNLVSITLPNSIVFINASSFENCFGLTNLILGNSITSISSRAFWGCKGLNNVILPNSVTSIGSGAFYGCSELSNISIPNSASSIGHDAFYDTAWYKNQPNGLLYAGLVAYEYKGRMPDGTTLIIKDGTIGIAGSAFYDCDGLTSVRIPNSVLIIGDHAFARCSELTSLTIPDSVCSIGGSAFYLCHKLSSIDFGKSIVSIGSNAFEGTAWYNNQSSGLVYAGHVAYKYKGVMQDNTNLSIKDGTLAIAEYAFSGYSELTSVLIPNSVVNIDSGAFYNCTGLTSMDLPNTVTSIGNSVFSGCTSLTNITIPSSITTIDSYTFSNCTELSHVIIGHSVTSIGFSAFDGDTSLCNIYCYAKNPPICKEKAFTSFMAELHVPAASLAAYFTAPIWENFDNMVGDAVEPLLVNISQTGLEILLGETASLTAIVLPNNAYPNTITWSSSNTDIATVEEGIVTAVSAGECDIIATCLDKQAICHVVVKDVTISIYLDQNEAQLLPNHIITLIPTASSEILPELAVSSSDPNIASGRVSNGIIRIVGIKEGTATITVDSADGTAIPATCLVTVYTEQGDLDCDGFLTISDVTSMIDYLLSGDTENIKVENADVNGDGNVSISDVTALIDILLRGE